MLSFEQQWTHHVGIFKLAPSVRTVFICNKVMKLLREDLNNTTLFLLSSINRLDFYGV